MPERSKSKQQRQRDAAIAGVIRSTSATSPPCRSRFASTAPAVAERSPDDLALAVLRGPAGSWLAEIERELERDPKLVSRHSRRGYLADLRAFENWRGGRPLSRKLVTDYLEQLRREKRAFRSINRALAAVKWWARTLSQIVFETPAMRRNKAARDEIVAQLDRVSSAESMRSDEDDLLAGREIRADEFAQLLDVCRKDTGTPAGKRDAAILALAWATGARIEEVVGLACGDLKQSSRGHYILIRHAKGEKRRRVPLAAQALKYLSAWLSERGGGAGPMFCPVRKNGVKVLGRGLSQQALAKILRRRALQAGLKEPITFHDFRRTLASQLLARQVDLRVVQRMLGHKQVGTTALYDRRGEEVVWDAAGKVQVPGAG